MYPSWTAASRKQRRQKNLPAVREYEKSRYEELRDKIFTKFGGKCANPACQWLNADGSRGCTDRRCLQIDHVYGDGYQESKRIGRGLTFLRQVLMDIAGRYQLLCANCNWIKRRRNQEENQQKKFPECY